MTMEPPITKMHHGGTVHGYQSGYDVIVIHDEEFPLSGSSAESIGAYFEEPNHGPSCAHYIEDADSEQHCVPDSQIAYHAPPNMNTIGIERDGYASWSAAQWNTPAAQKTTCRQAARTGELCARRTNARGPVPPIWLSVADLQAGKRGVSSHMNRSRAFGQSTHTDPGPAFPVDNFMAMVRQATAIFSSAEATKSFQKSNGLTVDGIPGRNTVARMAEVLFTSGPIAPAPKPKPKPAPIHTGVPIPTPQLAVDGVLGKRTIGALQRVLVYHGYSVGTTGIDSSFGPNTKKALQRYLGVPADGDVGPRTVSVLQKHVGAPADGIIGPNTIRHLQDALNHGRF